MGLTINTTYSTGCPAISWTTLPRKTDSSDQPTAASTIPENPRVQETKLALVGKGDAHLNKGDRRRILFLALTNTPNSSFGIKWEMDNAPESMSQIIHLGNEVSHLSTDFYLARTTRDKCASLEKWIGAERKRVDIYKKMLDKCDDPDARPYFQLNLAYHKTIVDYLSDQQKYPHPPGLYAPKDIDYSEYESDWRPRHPEFQETGGIQQYLEGAETDPRKLHELLDFMSSLDITISSVGILGDIQRLLARAETGSMVSVSV